MYEVVQDREVIDVKEAPPAMRMPNAASIAEDILTKAAEFCAMKMDFSSPQMTVAHVKNGERAACEYFQYGIARQFGANLSVLDDHIKAVYILEYDATPEDLSFSEVARAPLLHLIVWTTRKTEALKSLVAILEHALARSYARFIGPRQLQHLLDVQVIDDAEMKGRIGYGALLSSLHHRPLMVWER